jgi:hypothetical protein
MFLLNLLLRLQSGFVVFNLKVEKIVTPKLWYLSTKLHSVITQRTTLLTFVAV